MCQKLKNDKLNVFHEELSVVAFIDILGFKDIITSPDDNFRSQVISLLERLSEFKSTFGEEVESLGIGSQRFVNPEISSFSDNIVISMPLSDNLTRGALGYSSQHMINLLTVIISTIWQGLHLGILFRGAITLGKIYHSGSVVAGKGLVDAVELEKKTKWPRIEIMPEVLNWKDSQGKPLLSEDDREILIYKENNSYFVNSLAYHIGVWWDYCHYNNKVSIEIEEVKSLLNNISLHIENNLKELERRKITENTKELDSVIEKWKWFKKSYENSQNKDDWQKMIWKNNPK